jgi:hypothetical protein
MKWIRKYELFKESKSEKVISSKNPILEICTSMVLLNNEFLDRILNLGLKARYSENSDVFINDLKSLLNRNRLHIGKFIEGDICVIDDDLSKINMIFSNIKFDIENDYDVLVKSRDIARNIIEKIIPGEKLDSDRIKYIFLNINKDKDHQEDIVLETLDGKQYSFYLNKNISNQKSASFNLFADDLIGTDIDKLYKEEYLPKWDKLTQEWIRLIYENSNKNIQLHIEKFIDPKRIDSIGYFEYFDIRHMDPKFKHLGEFIKEFNKNILKFSELMNEIWKMKDNCFMDTERVYKEWMETKIVILNSKILENLLTNSLKSNHVDDIKKLDDGYKLAGGTVKMKLFKTLVEKMGCLERPVYFLGNNGNIFNMVPSREFFRKNYDDLNIKFDYHVNFTVNEDEEMNDFNIKIILEMDENPLINMNILVKFASGEMSGKLSAKYKFDLSDNFNYLISKKEMGSEE